jgi:predicted RNase H-like nuclease (RuvC/YqgF family)
VEGDVEAALAYVANHSGWRPMFPEDWAALKTLAAEVRRLRDENEMLAAQLHNTKNVEREQELQIAGHIARANEQQATRDRLAQQVGELQEHAAAFAEIAHIVGIEYAADGHASQPGPVETVANAVREGVEARGHAIELDVDRTRILTEHSRLRGLVKAYLEADSDNRATEHEAMANAARDAFTNE